MPFAAALRKSLAERDTHVLDELNRGDSLEEVLNRHLRTVEELGDDEVFTTVLLLSSDGKTLTYGAAPTVPQSYCRASERYEIGPNLGSCAAAAYYGRPVYSADIAKDAVWGGLGSLALEHGFRSCWSTPIRNRSGEIIGTFAILRRTAGMPTTDEIKAIHLIIGHVADAIMCFRTEQDLGEPKRRPAARSPLKLVCDNEDGPESRLLALTATLESKAADLELYSSRAKSPEAAETLQETAVLCRQLVEKLRAGMRDEVPRDPFQ